MMKTRLLILSIIIFSVSFINEANAQKKMDDALNGFLQTEFMKTFMQMRMEAESTIKTFKVRQREYAPYDVSRVENSYNRTAREFNNVLYRIKDDFLDREKLKYITEYPDTYAKGLELEMYKLSDFYAENFQQTLADVTGNDVDGSALFLLLTEIFGLTKEIVDYVGAIKKAAKQFNEAYLQEKLIEPYRFPLWHENKTGQSDIYSNNQGGYNGNNNGGGYNNNGDYNNGGGYNNNGGGYNNNGDYNNNGGGYNNNGDYNNNGGGYNNNGDYNNGGGYNNNSGYDNNEPYNPNDNEQPQNNGGIGDPMGNGGNDNNALIRDDKPVQIQIPTNSDNNNGGTKKKGDN